MIISIKWQVFFKKIEKKTLKNEYLYAIQILSLIDYVYFIIHNGK